MALSTDCGPNAMGCKPVLTRIRRRVYTRGMAGTNEDYLRRLKSDGRKDLLDKIDTGEMSIYKASLEAGYRHRKSAPSRADRISYHWKRANVQERSRFVFENREELVFYMKKVIATIKKHKNQDPKQ